MVRTLHPETPFAPCTSTSLRCADARDYRVPLRPCCRAHVIEIVRATQEELEVAGVVYWADYGTLLGAVRNPLTTWAAYPWLPAGETGPIPAGIVPHDKDADFGFLAEEWPKLMQVRAALERRGYSLLASPVGRKLKVRLSAMNHTNLDLFGWHARPNGEYYRPSYIEVDKYKGRDIPAGMLLPLSSVPWEGMTLPAPANPEAFCAFRYGSSWRTPIAANHDGNRR